MKIEIVTKNIDDDSMVREFIHRKVHFALDRFDSRINRVVVHLVDETARSSAFDGHCQIDAFINAGGQLHVSANGESEFDSVLQATRKIEHAVKHEFDKQRSSSRIRHQKTKRKFISSLGEDEFATIDAERDFEN